MEMSSLLTIHLKAFLGRTTSAIFVGCVTIHKHLRREAKWSLASQRQSYVLLGGMAPFPGFGLKVGGKWKVWLQQFLAFHP